MEMEDLTPENIRNVKKWIAENRYNIPVDVLIALRAVAPATVDETGWRSVYHLRLALDQVGNEVVMLDELEDGRIAALNGRRIAFYRPEDLRPKLDIYHLSSVRTLARGPITTITKAEQYENLPDGSIVTYEWGNGARQVAIKTEDDKWKISDCIGATANREIADVFINGAQVIRDGDA